jgi:hypothetical protein
LVFFEGMLPHQARETLTQWRAASWCSDLALGVEQHIGIDEDY